MLHSMYASQMWVWVLIRSVFETLLVATDCSDGHDQPVRMANPKVLHVSDKLHSHEYGSPNLHNVWAKIERLRAVYDVIYE